MTLKATGLLAGVSDLIVLLHEMCLFVELKNENGLQSEQQKEFEKTVTKLGFTYTLVRSLEDFKSLINDYI